MADIRFNFVATGVSDVAGAFRSIESAAISAERADRRRSTSMRASAGIEEKRYKDVEKYAARVQKELDREVAQKERAAKRAADVATREAKRAADAQVKEAARASTAAEREAARAARAAEREAKKAADAQVREAKRAAREKAAYEAQQQSLAAKRVARFDKSLSDFHGFDASPRGILKDAALGAVGFGTAALGVVGGAAREGMRLQDATNRLSIGARGAGESAVDAAILRREFQAAALANPGVKAADLAEGAQAFVGRTGDLAAARRFSKTFATISSASGASAQDIAGAGADLMQKFGLKSEEEMRQGLAALYFQGKSGAFELKDAASQFPRIGAAAQRFGGMQGVEGLKTLGGLTQLARSSTGGPEQAATAVEAMFRQLVAKTKDLTAIGASPFEKGSTTKTRNVQDVLVDVISKSGGSLPKLQNIFGEEGIRGISGLVSTFNEAKDSTKGTEAQRTAAGVAALREALEKAINAPGDWAEVVKDSAQAQKSSGAQLDAAWEGMKAKVSDRVVPALAEMAPKLTKLTGLIDPAITVFQALVYTAGLVVDQFKALGIIKGETPEEKLDKAQKDLSDFNARFEKGAYVPTAAEAEKKAQLEAALASARGEAFGLVGGEDKIGKSLSIDAFAQRYAELGGGDAEQRRQALVGAKGLASKIASGTASDYIEKNDTLQSFLGENEAQQRLRQRFQSDVAFDQGNTGGGSGGDKLNNAADKLIAAASKIEAAAAAQKQPSVFNGR